MGDPQAVARFISDFLFADAAVPLADAVLSFVEAQVARGFAPPEVERAWTSEAGEPLARASDRRDSRMPLVRTALSLSSALRRARRARGALDGSRTLWIDDDPDLSAVGERMLESCGAVIFYVGILKPGADRPAGSFGITNDPGELLHLVLKSVRVVQVNPKVVE